MVQPGGAGGGRWARATEGLGLWLLGLGTLGSLPLLARGAAELVGPDRARDLLVLVPTLLAVGAALAWALGGLLVGSGPRARRALVLCARGLALAACLAPAGLVLFEPSDPRLAEPLAWLLPAGLAAAGLGLALGRAGPTGGTTLALLCLGGAAGCALVPALETLAPGEAPPLAAALVLLAAATLVGHLLLLPAGLTAARERSRPGAPAGAPQHPRLAGCLVLAAGLLALVVLRTEAAWTGLAPGMPALDPGDPVLVLVTLAGLGLGALVLGRPLARGGPVALCLGLSVGLGWWLLRSDAAWAPAGLPELLVRPTAPAAPWPRALDQALALGPLLLVLGAAPVSLAGRILIQGGRAARRAGLAAWLLPLGLACLDPVAAAIWSEPGQVLAGLTGLLLLLVFLDADRPVPRVGAARGRLGRFGTPLLRASSLGGASAALVLVLGGSTLGPLPAWHAPGLAVDLVLDPAHAPRLELFEPLTGRRDLVTPGATDAAPADAAARTQQARSLLRALETDPQHGPPDLHLLTGAPVAEDLRAALADLPPGGLVVLSLSLDLPPERFALVLDTFAAELPAASAWFPGGQPLLLGGRELVPPDLADLDRGLATLADFVGVLGAAGPDRLGRLELRSLGAPAAEPAAALRRRARNLEHYLARATSLPVAWGPLLAGADGPLAAHPVLVAGRRMRQARLAHLWLAHHAEAAPGSLALETWQGRLDQALGACLEALPGHRPALELAAQAEAEDDARRGLALLRSGEPARAIPLLLGASERWPERRDLALGLGLALDLSGNRAAAELVLGDLGDDRELLLGSALGRELVALGLDPELVGAGDR